MGLRDLAKKVIGRGRAEPPKAAPAAPVVPPRAAPAAKATPATAAPAKAPPPAAEAEEKPWYLQGQEDLDGWDETNPGEEPGKKNLRS